MERSTHYKQGSQWAMVQPRYYYRKYLTIVGVFLVITRKYIYIRLTRIYPEMQSTLPYWDMQCRVRASSPEIG